MCVHGGEMCADSQFGKRILFKDLEPRPKSLIQLRSSGVHLQHRAGEQKAQAGIIHTRLSWNAPPAAGAGWSQPVSVLMPLPSSKASFGQIDSAIRTPRRIPASALA